MTIKKKYMILVLVVVVIVGIWSAWSWYILKGLEEPAYTVLHKRGSYEVRLYEPYIVAQTEVGGEYRDAMNEGFRNIAGYIFGGNTSKEKIAMTSPVLEKAERDVSEKIAMTIPVLDTGDIQKRTIAFVMPRQYTMETLPEPELDNVTFRELPERKIAVLSYGLYTNASRIEHKKEELRRILKAEGVQAKGEMTSARYNPPYSMPLFVRSEVMIEIE